MVGVRYNASLLLVISSLLGAGPAALASAPRDVPCSGQDGDGDGFSCDEDCDDGSWAVSPAAIEDEANGVDDNCNGIVDEADGDQDGATEAQGDCNDGDAAVYPAAVELADGVDQDCDGEIDEDIGPVDEDGDGYAPTSGDCNDDDAGVSPGSDEAPNGRDDDCDGVADEGTAVFDDDGDGFCEGEDLGAGAPVCTDGSTVGDCNDQDGSVNPAAQDPLNGIDDNCDGLLDDGVVLTDDHDGDGYTPAAGDCDDGDASRVPGAAELADGVDQDCDGAVDEGTSLSDDDGDGIAEEEGAWPGGDCNDSDAGIAPGAAESVDGVDEDCDGSIDEGSAITDDDGDGFSEVEGDCDDGDAAVGPAMSEVVGNGVDDNCNGAVDEDPAFDDALDVDGDGFTIEDGDCDDLNSLAYPDGPEYCDGIDNNCDGVRDPENCAAPGSGSGGCNTAGGAGASGLAFMLLGMGLLLRRRAPLVALLMLVGCRDDVAVQQIVGRLGFAPEGGVMDFGPINVGETVTSSFYLFNAGGGPIAIASVRVEAGDGGAIPPFEAGDGFSGTLEVGQEVEIPLTYAPDEAGTHIHRLIVSHQVSGSNELGITPITLRGRAAELDVALIPSLVDFGPVPMGSSASREVTLLNRGLAVVDLATIRSTHGAFEWALTGLGDELPLKVASGGQARIAVRFEPTQPGPMEGDLTLNVAGHDISAELVGNRCEGSSEAGWDVDGDGYALCGGDCDDGDALIGPFADEAADGVDDDCDGRVDEGTAAYDDDGDCFCEVAPCVGSIVSCPSVDGGDCNDDAPAVHPGAPEHGKDPEALENGIDDDCDGAVDDTVGGDFDDDGVTQTAGDCDDQNAEVRPGAEEAADGVDQDCDGSIDEGTAATDDDLDGYCEGAELAGPGSSLCLGGATPGDCDDHNPDRAPDHPEEDDGVDNDCDGLVDEGAAPVDLDGDGYTAAGGDCDDTEADIRPGAGELCNGVDDNCDGIVGDAELDSDGDGLLGCDGDCDDGDAQVQPGAPERCNGIDDDCNGLADPPGDADSDGIPNDVEGEGDLDGDGIPNCLDADADGDWASDESENGSGASPADADTDDDGFIDLVEIVLGTDPTDPSDNPDVSADVVFVAPEGQALIPDGPVPLRFDTFIQMLDLYWGFDQTSSMKVELGFMKSVVTGVPFVISELTCAQAVQCVDPDDCGDGSPMESVPCLERADCGEDFVCSTNNVCIEDPLARGCVPDIWTGLGLWDELDTYINTVSLQPNAGLTAGAIPIYTNSGVFEAPYQAAACVADGANCANSDISCSPVGRGCPGFRDNSLAIYLQVTDANDQCSGELEEWEDPDPECVPFTADFAGQELADERIRFIGLYGEERGDNTNDVGLGTPRSVAEGIALASGTVDSEGNPYLAETVDEDVGVNTIAAVRSLLRTFPMSVTIEATDQGGDSGDALLFIDALTPNTSGLGGCTADQDGVPLHTVDTDGDGAPDAFSGILSGTSVCWDLVPRPTNDIAPAGAAPLLFHAVLTVRGEGALLDRRDVFFIVPPIIENPSF